MPMCNGAGELPGQEGNDSYDDVYSAWLESSQERILEMYKDSLDIDDVPEEFTKNMYNGWTE